MPETTLKLLGGDIGRAPNTSTFAIVPTSPLIIVENNPITKQYTIYDKAGKMSDQFNYAYAGNKAYNLDLGQMLALP